MLLVLAAWGRPGIHWYFAATKPLDHRPFRQQVTEWPTVSPKVTYGGEWKTLVFPLGVALDSLLRRYFALALSYFTDYTSQLNYHTLFYTDQRTSFADYSESTLNCLLARHSDTSHIHSFT